MLLMPAGTSDGGRVLFNETTTNCCCVLAPYFSKASKRAQSYSLIQLVANTKINMGIDIPTSVVVGKEET